jgi:hypothetical protein
MSKCKHTHTNMHASTHTFHAQFFSLIPPSPFSPFLTFFLLGVSYFITNPPHTPGSRVASCTVVCPFTFLSTSTLQKGSESPLLLVCARVWWHSVCACVRVSRDAYVYKIGYLTRRSLHMLHQTPAFNPTSLYTHDSTE